jgi:hypothetical protein
MAGKIKKYSGRFAAASKASSSVEMTYVQVNREADEVTIIAPDWIVSKKDTVEIFYTSG